MGTPTIGRVRGRHGFSIAEVAIVALIAGTSMIFVMSLGQANAQLSQINADSIFARQIANDLLEYYANHPDDAKLQFSDKPQPANFIRDHLAFKDTLAQSADARALFEKLKPQVFLNFTPNLEFAKQRYVDFHRIDCSVKWFEGGPGDKNKRERVLTASRLVADFQ